MKYQELRKLYYGDETTYKQTYEERFRSDLAIKLNFFIGDKQAFFIQSEEVIESMYTILRLDKRITSLSRELPGKAIEQYSKKCLIDEIVLTNKIEGVYSSRKEIGEVLTVLEERSTKKGKHERFIGLVNKYLKLMKHDDVALSTCSDVRSIYDEIVLAEVVSENKENAPDGQIFRKDQTTIRSATDRIIHTGMTPEKNIINAMEEALLFLNDASIEKLYRICLFHYMLEYIHPFYDGNGRLGRFILSYCISESLEPLLAYRISETIKANLKEYYQAFETCNDVHNLGDLTPFLIMMLQMFQKAANELENSLNRKLISWRRYERLVGNFNHAAQKRMKVLYSLLIQAALFGEEGISAKELTDILEVSRGTLRKRLSMVSDEGLLVVTRDGSEKFYRINTAALDNMLLDNVTDKRSDECCT